jgi:C4-dicarboxylate transporter DctM subunit
VLSKAAYSPTWRSGNCVVFLTSSITAPILFPIAMKLGIDPIHFGILIAVNMEIGMITPPVGLNLYVASGISKLGLTEMSISVWPWLLTMLAFLALVTYYPPLTTWLPKTMGMM